MFPDAFASHIGQPVDRRHSNAPRLIPVVLPSVEIVSVADYQLFMKIKENIDYGMIEDKIQSARELCEEFSGYIFGASVYDLYYDFIGPYFAGWTNFRLAEYYNIIELPRQPMVCVNGIWTRDSTGAEYALDSTMYNVSQTRRPGRITINTWPFMQVLNYPYIEQLRIRFTCGFATPATFTTVSPYVVGTFPISHGFNPNTSTPVYNSVRFRATGLNSCVGVLPAPLVNRVDYYAQVIDQFTFTLSTDPAGTNPIPITTNGTGVIFAQLQEGGLPISINRAILTVASRDRFAADPRSLRKIDAATDMPREAKAILRRFRRVTVT